MEKYNKIIIYYFSGTGNSQNVALWISNIAAEFKIPCEILNISQTERRNLNSPILKSLIIFISPVHGFNYPPIMTNFIFHFPKGSNNIVLMNTRAGMLIGNFITPGLSGITFYLAAIVLKIKGYKLKGMFPVDLPSNWISVHPGLNERTVKYLHKKNKEKVEIFAKTILSGKTVFSCLKEIIQDLLVSPISVLYYFIGRFFLSKTYYASGDCNNCGLCIKNCPVKAIKIVDKRPYWTFNCESCMKCMSNCPHKAIETSHGFTILAVLIFTPLILTPFYKYFTFYFFELNNEFGKFLFETVLFLGFFGIIYKIMHYLLRFKFFERIVVYTSLTKYKFWGRRYKAIKEK
ncbi:MAG: EFR1 family ferrodoxin [bacterium]